MKRKPDRSRTTKSLIKRPAAVLAPPPGAEDDVDEHLPTMPLVREGSGGADTDVDDLLSSGEIMAPERPPESPAFDQRYEQGELLGSGGMGEVRICRDLQIGRKVAVKTLHARVAKKGNADVRFLHEARVQAQLEHPAVTPVYDLGVDASGALYFTMRRVRGNTLGSILAASDDTAESGKYSLRRLLSAFATVCLAIDYAHRRGVVHRDLKPDNIMLGDFGEVYVLDWGLAKLHDDHSDDADRIALENDSDPLATRAGVVLGTPGYVAPERLEDDDGARAPAVDIYSLGAILFEILTRTRLHPQRTPEAIIVSTLSSAMPLASERSPERNIGPELDAICARAVARRPAERYKSARWMAEAIERYLDGERDEERRRELAAEHVEAAELAASRAFEREEAFDARQEAMRQLGRALALDPDSARAKNMLAQLFAVPPPTLPPEVAEQLEVAEDARRQRIARTAGHGFAAGLLFLPLLWAIGVNDWRGLAVYAVLAAASSLVAFHASRRKRGSLKWVMCTMVLSNTAFAATSVIAGALILMPTIVVLNTFAYVLVLTGRARIGAIVVGCVAVLVPLLLELAGVTGAYSFADGALTILPRVLPLRPALVIGLVAVFTIFSIVIGSIAAAQARDLVTKRERQLALYSWHLREFLPETLPRS